MTSLLTAADLAILRTELEAELTDTATIQSKTRTTGAQGNTYTYPVVATDVPTAFAEATQKERKEAAALGYETSGFFAFAWNRVILPTYRIVHDGLAYEVVALTPHQTNPLQQRIEVVRLAVTP